MDQLTRGRSIWNLLKGREAKQRENDEGKCEEIMEKMLTLVNTLFCYFFPPLSSQIKQGIQGSSLVFISLSSKQTISLRNYEKTNLDLVKAIYIVIV